MICYAINNTHHCIKIAKRLILFFKKLFHQIKLFRYSFAIVGINLTHMAYKLLHDSALKPHMFNINPHKPTMENFHHFYRYIKEISSEI